jgi:hypothetical protein
MSNTLRMSPASVRSCGLLPLLSATVARMSDAEPASGGFPARAVAVNQLVGFNMKWFRQAVGLTQEELGHRLGGWSKGVVSAAERSWDSQRVRQFDADEIVGIALALGVPVIALLLPPPGSGSTIDYAFIVGDERVSSDDLAQLVITDYQGETQAMKAFRERLDQIGGGWFLDSLRQEAARILMQARDASSQLLGDARDAADSLTRDASERHRQVMANLVLQYEALERRIFDLRAFEREYRTRLIEQLEDGLHLLRAGAADEGAFPPIPRVPPEATPQDEP